MSSNDTFRELDLGISRSEGEPEISSPLFKSLGLPVIPVRFLSAYEELKMKTFQK